MDYKGYTIEIENHPQEFAFNGYIKKGSVLFQIFREYEKVKHTFHRITYSLLRTTEETNDDTEFKVKETYNKLLEELKAIVDGIELFVEQESNKVEGFIFKVKELNAENIIIKTKKTI